MSKEIFPPVDTLPIDEETGYPIAPDGITVTKNGAGVARGGRGFVYPSGTFGEHTTAFDSESGREARMKRIEKKEQAIRESVRKRISEGDDDFTDIFAEAAGVLWEEIVLNRSREEHPGRTRMDVWKEIGKQAGIVPDRERSSESGEGASITIEGMTPELAREVRKIIELQRGE